MSLGKRGTDYRSFDYLRSGSDYTSFELAPQIDRVARGQVDLAAHRERRCRQRLSELVMISMQEHLGVSPAVVAETPACVRQGCSTTAFAGLTAALRPYFDQISSSRSACDR